MALSVMDCGAVGDGTADDTVAIQRAINDATDEVLFPPERTYCYDASVGLRIPGHRTLVAYGAELDPCFRASYPTRCRGLEIVPGAQGVRILGGIFDGGSVRPVPGTGMEWAIGLRVDGARDVIVDGAAFLNWYTDGVWIGGNHPTDRVILRNVACWGNRRNGLAIVNATRVLALESTFMNTVGTDPKAGADLEGNPGDTVEAATFLNCLFRGNTKGLYIQKGRGDRAARVKVIDCAFEENAEYHLIAAGVEGAVILGCHFAGGKFGASIGAGTSGVTFADNTLERMPRPLVLAGVENVKVYGNTFPAGTAPEQLPAGGRPGAFGDVVIMTNT